ncbi:MAG: heparinase II/III domain-containing protein, partial [Planctomycetota bacterium]
MSALFLDESHIEAMRRRVAEKEWAGRCLARMQAGLEARKPELLAGSGRPQREAGAGMTFLELALLSRLQDGWHREAADLFLRDIEDPEPYKFKEIAWLCQGLDLIEDLDEGLRDRVVKKILVPTADWLMDIDHGGGNIQTTYNLSLLWIGLLTGREDYLERVTSDPARGMPYQMANSVFPDGFWYEQCHASYHCGSIERLLRIRWLTKRNGIDLGGDEVIQKMLETLPGMALPGGILPLIGEVGGDSRPTLCKDWLELAYAMYQTPWIGWALERMDREGLWSLLIGQDIGPCVSPSCESRLYNDTGLCVLKEGEKDSFWDGQGSGVTISFGPHGDWHGHSSKLAIEYRHNENYLVRDHGHSGTYWQPIHRMWYMSTLAHSTLVLDERNQKFTWSKKKPELEREETGRCHAHLFNDDVSACTVSADFAYPGCRVLRTLFLRPGYLLDIMECISTDGKEHCFDWLMHTGGIIQTDLPFAKASLSCVNSGPPILSPEGQEYAPGSLL